MPRLLLLLPPHPLDVFWVLPSRLTLRIFPQYFLTILILILLPKQMNEMGGMGHIHYFRHMV